MRKLKVLACSLGLLLMACGKSDQPSPGDRIATLVETVGKPTYLMQAAMQQASASVVTGPEGYARIVLFSDDFSDPDLGNRYSIEASSSSMVGGTVSGVVPSPYVANGRAVLDTDTIAATENELRMVSLTTLAEFPVQNFALDISLTVNSLSQGNYWGMAGFPEMKYSQRFTDPGWPGSTQETTLSDVFFQFFRTELGPFNDFSGDLYKGIWVNPWTAFLFLVGHQIFQPPGSADLFDFQPDTPYPVHISYSTQAQTAWFEIPGVYSWQSGSFDDCAYDPFTEIAPLCGHPFFTSNGFHLSMRAVAVATTGSSEVWQHYLGPSRSYVEFDNVRLLSLDGYEASLPALYKNDTLYSPIIPGNNGEVITGAIWLPDASFNNAAFVTAPTRLPLDGTTPLNAYLVSNTTGTRITFYSPLPEGAFPLVNSPGWTVEAVPGILIANGPESDYTWNLTPGLSNLSDLVQQLFDTIDLSTIANGNSQLQNLQKALDDLALAQSALDAGDTAGAEAYFQDAIAHLDDEIEILTNHLRNPKAPPEYQDWLDTAIDIRNLAASISL